MAGAAAVSGGGRTVELASNTALNSVNPTDNPRQFTIGSSGGLIGGRLSFPMGVTDGLGGSDEQFWLFDGAASNYDAFVTVTSGTLSSGDATGTWINLGTTRNWIKSASGAVSLSVQIGLAGAATGLRTHTINL